MTSSKKLIRHRSLKKLLRDNPFSTDEQLAKMLDVSVQTIRLDRVALGIPELRARTRTMAEEAQTKLRAIDKKDIVGELLDLELNKIGISTLKITPDMVLERTGIARGYYMFAMANTLRNEGLNAVLHYGGGSFKSQFKKTDASGARFAVVLGDEEAQKRVASVKHLTGDKMGEQMVLPLDAVAAFIRGY